MNRRLALVLNLLGMLLMTCVVVAAAGSHGAQGPVYTVAEVRARLARDPETVLGRTLWVRGVADTCALWVVVDYSLCAKWETSLRDAIDTGDARGMGWIPLQWAPSDPLLAFARRVPVLDVLLPAARTPQWNQTATYRVQIRRWTSGSCGGAACYAAVLLNAATSVLPQAGT